MWHGVICALNGSHDIALLRKHHVEKYILGNFFPSQCHGSQKLDFRKDFSWGLHIHWFGMMRDVIELVTDWKGSLSSEAHAECAFPLAQVRNDFLLSPLPMCCCVQAHPAP